MLIWNTVFLSDLDSHANQQDDDIGQETLDGYQVLSVLTSTITHLSPGSREFG